MWKVLPPVRNPFHLTGRGPRCQTTKESAYLAGLDPHVPDMSTQEGILDIIALGNLLEFSVALSQQHYAGLLGPEAIAEQNAARWRYRVLMNWFGSKYATLIGDEWIHPSYLVNRLLVEFAAALVVYKRAMVNGAPEVKICDPSSFQDAIAAHLETDHPSLVPVWEELITQTEGLFYWSGPAIKIRERTAEFKLFLRLSPDGELSQLANRPIYVSKGPPPEVEMEDIEAGDGERVLTKGPVDLQEDKRKDSGETGKGDNCRDFGASNQDGRVSGADSGSGHPGRSAKRKWNDSSPQLTPSKRSR